MSTPALSPPPADTADLLPAGRVEAAPPRSAALRLVTLAGSAGLLAATVTDALAVAGRHLGVALLGSIEIVQVTVVLIASAAMIVATAERAHAAVHIVTGRLGLRAAAACRAAAAWLCALFFLVVAAGSAWLAFELWYGVERTELLGIPFRPFRLLWIAASLAVAALFARQATVGRA